MRRWRCGSGTFRMNVALSQLPSFTALPGQHGGGPSYCGHHPRPQPRLHGPRLWRCPPARLEPRADHRAADPVDLGRHAGAARRACGEPVLPARCAGAAGRQLVDRASRNRGGPDDRDGRSLCARLQGQRARAPGAQPARSRAGVRPHRRRHLPRRAFARSAVLGAARARLCRLSRAAAGLYHCGSGAHPGGGVTGAPGHNAARAIIADRRRRR